MRHHAVVAITLLCLLAGSPVRSEDRSLLSVAVSGQITGAGVQDPQYVLSFPEVQQLVVDAAAGPLAPDQVEAALAGIPIGPDHLVDLRLLRRENDRYRLDFVLLTVADQQRIHEVGGRFARSLADAFIAERRAFDRIWSRYGVSGRREEIAFVFIAGFLLNWEGLRLSTELGFRAAPRKRPNGDRYIIHARQPGLAAGGRGIYLSSHTGPGGQLMFSTFGDGASHPRLTGLPNLLEAIFERAMEAVRQKPDLAAALKNHAMAYVLEELADAGAVMVLLTKGQADLDTLKDRLDLPPGRVEASVGLLSAIGYVANSNDGTFRNDILVLTGDDLPLWTDARDLGRSIISGWLQHNHDRIREALPGLTPVRNGVPFELVFNEVWHSIFGQVTGLLAEAGFYQDPYAENWRHQGFVPVAWTRDLREPPGSD